MGMSVLKSTTPEEQATSNYVSFSGFGEEKFYIEYRRFFISGGKFSLYRIIPLEMNFYIKNLPDIENLPPPRNIPVGLFSMGDAFLYDTGRYIIFCTSD